MEDRESNPGVWFREGLRPWNAGIGAEEAAWSVSQVRGQTALGREPNLAVVPVYPSAFRNRNLLRMENRTS